MLLTYFVPPSLEGGAKLERAAGKQKLPELAPPGK